MQSENIIRYSEAFKIQVVRELESGIHENYNAAKRAYGIGSASTIINWHSKYGNTYKKRRFIRVESKTDKDKLEQLQARVRELEGALSDTTIDLLLEREYLKMACKEAGIEDVNSFKKKEGTKASTPSSKRKHRP